VRSVIKGEVRPSPHFAAQLAAALGMSLEALLKVEG
jgi:hypothetical protein